MAELDLSRFDAVLLDLDGTMVDTLGDFVAALNRMLADLPSPFSHARLLARDVERLVGKGSEHLIRAVLLKVQSDHAGAPGAAANAAQADLHALYPFCRLIANAAGPAAPPDRPSQSCR